MIDLVRSWVEAGGAIIVILGIVSFASVSLIAYKAFAILPARRGGAARAQALSDWAGGARSAARDRVAAGRSPIDRALSESMGALLARRGAEAARAEAERVGAAELEALARHLRLLDLIAMTAPLMGLLGTVLGMIRAFRDLELAGGAANAAALAGGIWQALLTTAAGLIVAIPAGLAAGLFSARVDRVGHDIEDAVGRLLAAEDGGPSP